MVRRRTSETSTQDKVEDLAQATKDYAVDQIVGPIRGAGRWLAFGTAGAACLGISMLFALLATLRLVQDLGGGALDGAWSFVPYLATIAGALPVIVFTLSRINTESLAKEKR